MSTPDTSPANPGVILLLRMVMASSSRMSFGGKCVLCRRHFSAADGGAAHVAHLGLVVAAHTMHDLAVLPHHQIPLPPPGRIDELRLRGVLRQVADEGARLRHRPADDRAD